MSRPPEIILAESAPLNTEQLAFRHRAKGRLDLALPLDVWLNHYYSVVPAQHHKPVSTRGAERWYSYMQVAKHGLDPRIKRRRRIVVVNGGSMSNVGRKRRP